MTVSSVLNSFEVTVNALVVEVLYVKIIEMCFIYGYSKLTRGEETQQAWMFSL